MDDLKSINVSGRNKRIAKNTMLLYMRMLLLMLVSLYTSRINLNALGIVDFGIYGVVGGVVSMFYIVSNALVGSINRFLAFEIGAKNQDRLNKVFCTAKGIQYIIVGVVFLLAETVGLWFLNYKMVIPADRIIAANWIYQFSTISFCMDLLVIPYTADIIAHENMSAFAYISILTAVGKLIVAWTTMVAPIDHLIWFGALILANSTIIRSIYIFYCKRNFEECRFVWGLDKNLLSNMFIFSSWAFLGNGAIVLKDQGTTILLNLFSGPAVNASQGIAMQIKNAVFSFVSNFMTASAPQITKSFAAKEMDKMFSLTFMTCKYGFYLMILMLMPIYAGIDYILSLWLIEVPEHTANFIILTLIYSLIECYATPIVRGVLADGKIKNYEIALTFIYLMNILGSYLCLKSGSIVEIVFILNIIFKVFVVILLIIHSYQRFNFPIIRFLKEVLMPNMVVFFISFILVFIITQSENMNLLTFLIQSVIIFITTTIVIYLFGINKKERSMLNKIIAGRVSNIFFVK